MQIREAQIFSFGKIKEKKFRFAPGINVIYGANEAGKSTLHAFLLAMFFGMEKGRGRASAKDDYKRYEPWHAPAYYSGSVRFEVEGRPFYLERNFYQRERREFLRNEADGEELSVTYGDLTMLLGGIRKETFGNTYDIPQSGAVTGKELADALAEYLSDAAESGDAGFRVTRAVESLREKKRKLGAELKQNQSEKEQRRATLCMEQELLQRDCQKQREDMEAARQHMMDMHAKEESAWAKQPAESRQTSDKTRAKSAICLGNLCIVFAAVLILAIVWILMDGKAIWQSGASLLAGGLGVAAIFLGLSGRSIIRRAKKHMPLSMQQETEEKKPNYAEQMFSLLCESLEEKETRLYNITEQLEQIGMQTERELELQQEMDAVQLAADELERLAKESCEEAGDTLNSEVSRYISAITCGRYDSVRVDEGGKLWASIDGKEVSPEALSRGTLEQFYLALRLAVGKTVTREETMPIFLDDAFVLYDDERLEQTLKVLSNLNTQVILFTCQKREAELLTKMRITYHRIDL